MISFRRLSKNSIIAAPIHNVTAPNAIQTSAQYDDLINVAGREGDFASVRRLLTERQSHGCLNTSNTFNFIATNISALDDLLQNLAVLGGDWFARKNAHDALVAQLAKLYRTADALRVVEVMAEKRYGATAATFHPILNALAHKKEMSAAWRVVDTMRARGFKPVPTSLNYILTAYCFDGDVASAAKTVVKMEAYGMVADAITYDALVLGACRAGKVEAAVAVVRRMVGEGLPPLFSSHVHIIKEMVRRRYYALAVEYVRIFAGKDEKLDAENFGYLVRRLRNGKRIAEAKSVVEEMARRGLPIDGGLKDLCLVNDIED
ncbi:pentatricopeptide repeat-containing protein at3g56030 [Phtheirospermum japonicum]|uniref:Pentatricopeptide repeat-containing protein at3g56030 n=1 Tax=Phtheirospermum japonicum TaxID=374723 RepID=A0A830CEN0_9LAMI|nr:pentatricopeptide repeat-containing protein at3g56030 [Phtheirospermum japonicum]